MPVGDTSVTLRSSHSDLVSRLACWFPGARPGDDSPAAISILSGAVTDRGRRTKHVIYVDGSFLLATSSDGHLQRAVTEAVGFVSGARSPTAVASSATALVGHDSVVVVDGTASSLVRSFEGRLGGAGWSVANAPGLLLDLDRQVTDPLPPVTIDSDAVAQLERPRRFESAPLPPLDAAQLTWLVPESGESLDRWLLRSVAAAPGSCVGLGDQLERLRAFAEAGTIRSFEDHSDTAVVDAIAALA